MIDKVKRLLKDILESIKGTEQDYSTGRLSRSIILLSIPMVLEMVLESVFAIVDIFFVSKLGADAVATVGITESLMTIVYSLGIGLGVGATAIISRRIGEKKSRLASITAIQTIIIGVFISLLIAIPSSFYAKELLALMGASQSVIDTGWRYTSLMNFSSVFIILLFVNNAIFRSSGDAAISMRVLWVANIINIVLDPILIYGLGPIPAMGVTGAAVATTIGRGIGVVYQFYLLFSNQYRIKIDIRKFIPNIPIMFQLIKLSLGAIMQNIIVTSSWIGLVRIIASYGSEVVAGYTIAIRIVIFTLLPSFGLSNAASTLVGQNLGAKQPKRAERAVWITGITNMVLLGIVGAVLAIWAHSFIAFFISNPTVQHYGEDALRIISFGYMSYALGMVFVQGINGSGETFIPTGINFICFWIIEIPLAYFLAKSIGMNEFGVYFAILIAETMIAILGMSYFKWGNWREKII